MAANPTPFIVPPLFLNLSSPSSSSPSSQRKKPPLHIRSIPEPPLSARGASPRKPFSGKLIKTNSLAHLFGPKKSGSQPSFSDPSREKLDPLSNSMIELPPFSLKDSSSSSLSGSPPESPKSSSASPRVSPAKVSPRIETVSTVVTDISPKPGRQSSIKLDPQDTEKRKRRRFLKRIGSIKRPFRTKRQEAGVMHAGLTDEQGNLFPIDCLQRIHPSQFLRSCPNAADITISLPAAPGEVRIDCSQLTLDEIISELNFVFSTPELGYLEDAHSASSSPTTYNPQLLATGIFSTSDFHLLSAEEKSAAYEEERLDKERLQQLLALKESGFKDNYPELYEKLGLFIDELMQIDYPAFDRVVAALQTFLKESPDNGKGLRRLFFQLKNENPTPPSYKYYTFENLPLEIAIKKLFPDKKVEIAHILQLISINAFRVADLLFKQDYPRFYRDFAFAKNSQSMSYSLQCHDKNHWTIKLVKWCDIIDKDLKPMTSSSISQRAIATMAYSIAFEVNPFAESGSKIMAGKMNIENLDIKIDESDVSATRLKQIISRRSAR